MLLIATYTQLEVDEIHTNLVIEEKNFIIVRDSTNHRSKIIFSI